MTWPRSSYSGGNGDCVEVRWPDQIGVAVRPVGGTLAFPGSARRAFVTRTR
jgi:hypothetical protein